MKIEIKSWMNGSVLFSLETETLKLCLEAAIKGGADLRGANLRDAYLRGADLQHTFDEWRELAEKLGQEDGYSALDVKIYKLHIEHIANVSQLLWNQKKEAST